MTLTSETGQHVTLMFHESSMAVLGNTGKLWASMWKCIYQKVWLPVPRESQSDLSLDPDLDLLSDFSVNHKNSAIVNHNRGVPTVSMWRHWRQEQTKVPRPTQLRRCYLPSRYDQM